MITLPCFFRRLGDANKYISSMDLPGGLQAPLGLLPKSLPFSSSPGMGTARQETSLLLCAGRDCIPRHRSSGIPPAVTLPALAIKAKCAGPASVGPLFSRQVEKDFLLPSSSFPRH